MSQPDPRSIACLERLIGFDTTSRNSNIACMDWARGHLEGLGARIRMNPVGTDKVNMLATFGDGPGGIVLSGHVDVVPVDGQAWTSDPFTATLRDGRIHGRGACDMKGFDAVILGHAPDFAAAALRQPIHIALTCDEELGCTGIPHLIRAMDEWGIHPTGCIVGEPTDMQLVSAHKGGRVYRCTVKGRAAHSSRTHTAVNAIEYAARIIARIHEIGARERDQGLRVEGFDVPFSTISTNLIEGGSGQNIVPAICEFLFDYRYVPGFDPDSIMHDLANLAAALQIQMQMIDPDTGISFRQTADIPALPSAEGSDLFAMAHGLLDNKQVAQVAYGTEASFFSAYGVPSIVCGPGSIEQAHKADEYVSLEQIALCDRFIDGVVRHLSV